MKKICCILLFTFLLTTNISADLLTAGSRVNSLTTNSSSANSSSANSSSANNSSINTLTGENQWIDIKGEFFAVDSLNGVAAYYTDKYNGVADEIYSCAAYVKRYYKYLYGVNVYNLHQEGPPVLHESGGHFVKTAEPKIGDIVFWPLSRNKNNHSAIVKEVSGNKVTLIEQNYKSSAKALLNRTVSYPSSEFVFYRFVEGGSAAKSAQNSTNVLITENKNELTTEKVKNMGFIFPYGVVKDIQGTSVEAKVTLENNTGYTSYIIQTGIEYSFTIAQNSVMECWFLENGTWKKAAAGSTIRSERFYITMKN